MVGGQIHNTSTPKTTSHVSTSRLRKLCCHSRTILCAWNILQQLEHMYIYFRLSVIMLMWQYCYQHWNILWGFPTLSKTKELCTYSYLQWPTTSWISHKHGLVRRQETDIHVSFKWPNWWMPESTDNGEVVSRGGSTSYFSMSPSITMHILINLWNRRQISLSAASFRTPPLSTLHHMGSQLPKTVAIMSAMSGICLALSPHGQQAR